MKKLLPVFVLIAVLLSACQGAAPQAADLAIDTITPALVAQGHLEPAQFIDLAFAQPGRVAEVLVQEGQMVTAGQALARLEGQPAAQAALERARLETLTAAQALEALSPDLAAAQAALAVANAEKAVEDAREALENVDDDGSILTREQARAALELAHVQLDMAEQLQADLDETGDPAIMIAAQRLAAAQAAESAAQAALDALELKAPMAGTVTALALKAGQFVPAGQVVLSLADLTFWVVKTSDLTELAVTELAEGQAVTVNFDALPDAPLNGVVTSIAQRFEEKRGDITYTVTIAIDNPVPGMRWGMTGQVLFEDK